MDHDQKLLDDPAGPAASTADRARWRTAGEITLRGRTQTTVLAVLVG